MNEGTRRLPAGRAVRFTPLVCFVVVFAAITLAVTVHPAGVFWDDGVYLISARALATGEGYAFTHLPGAPPAVHFPPAWPLVLAGVWKLAPAFPSNLPIFAFVNAVIAAAGAGIVCAYAVRRAGIPAAVALPAVVAFALTLPVLVLDGVLFAEPLFLVAVVGALVAADRAVDGGGVRAAVIAGVVVGAASLVRSTAIVLVPAVAIALLTVRRPREAAIASGAALAMVVPWMAWSGTHAGELAEPLLGNYGPYASWFATAIAERGAEFAAAIARQNVVSLQRSFAVVFFPVGLTPLRPLLIALLGVVVALGMFTLWRHARTLVLFGLAYALLVVVWPYAPDRFAWAVWPLVGVVIASGTTTAWQIARHAAAPAGQRAAAGLLCGVAVLAVAGDVFYSARGVSRGWVDVAQRRNAARLAPVVDWVNGHTPPDAVIASDGEPLVHLYTGRRVMPVHVLTPDEYLAGTPVQLAADNMRALIRAGGADFAVLSGRSAGLAAASLLGPGTGSPWLTPLDTLPGGGVAYRVEHQP